MAYVRQRQDLLDMNLLIPYVRLISHKQGQTQLKAWVPVLGYNDDDGLVFTQAGAFYSIDLDYSLKSVKRITVKEVTT